MYVTLREMPCFSAWRLTHGIEVSCKATKLFAWGKAVDHLRSRRPVGFIAETRSVEEGPGFPGFQGCRTLRKDWSEFIDH